MLFLNIGSSISSSIIICITYSLITKEMVVKFNVNCTILPNFVASLNL